MTTDQRCTDLIPFLYGEQPVRTLAIDGDPWFVGTDVARILGYSNPSDAVRRIDDRDQRTATLALSEGSREVSRKRTLINESGVYELVFSSSLPLAREFKHWVTSEVLPAIRRYGGYLTPELTEQVLTDPDTIIRLATDLKAERARRAEVEAQKAVLESKVEADAPKVVFADAVATSHTSILVRELAKLIQQAGLDIKPMDLFERLRQDGFLIRAKSSDYNLPTQKSRSLGLFEIKETPIVHDDGRVTVNRTPKVTGRGQTYLINYYLRKAA